jgi:hypothetical protein
MAAIPNPENPQAREPAAEHDAQAAPPPLSTTPSPEAQAEAQPAKEAVE